MWYRDSEQFKSENGYDINGEWYPRVTRIIQVKAKPALEHFFREVGDYSSVEEIKNKSAQEGSLTHAVVERFLLGESLEVSNELRPVVEALEKFNQGGRIKLVSDFVERRVWSASGKYAGTVDALAEINGRYGVLDIKTSTGFYPDYNLQTAAYVAALREEETKKALSLPREIETRWILRVDQCQICQRCGASLRLKGGRHKVRIRNGGASHQDPLCLPLGHDWGEVKGVIEMREFPEIAGDWKAFQAAKVLWDWENDYWLKQIGYVGNV